MATRKPRVRTASPDTPTVTTRPSEAQKILSAGLRPKPTRPVVKPSPASGSADRSTGKTRGARRPTTPPTATPAASASAPSRGQRRQAEAQQRHQKARRRSQGKRRARQVAQAAEQAQAQVAAETHLATLPVQHAHAAGIDVGDASHWVCVEQTPDGTANVREFSAMSHGLRALIAWLRQCGVTTVALEATGIYSHILFLSLLEAGFQALLVSPQFTRQIKGRPKTDKRDCQWIQRLHKLGLLPAVFQPDEATQTLRDYVRQRANHVRLSSQHIQRMQKALELMNLKLTKVLSDITGVTGLRIIRAILQGERDPLVLAKLRDGRCAHPAAEIAQALDGRYRPEHLLELKLCLSAWEHYQQIIRQLDQAIDQQLQQMRRDRSLPPLPPRPHPPARKPHAPQFDVRTALYYATGVDLTAIDGIEEMTALVLVSELGTDMSKWPTVKHFGSWLGLSPNWKKTGGKVKSSRTRRGKNRAALALRMAGYSLLSSKSYLGAYVRRQKARLGAPKAITAAAYKLARIVYNMLRYGVAYAQKSEAEYAAQVRERQLRNLQRRARELGFTLQATVPAGEVAPSAAAEPVGREAAASLA